MEAKLDAERTNAKYAKNASTIKILGKYIKGKREKIGITQKELASSLEVPTVYIEDLEAGYLLTLSKDKLRVLPMALHLDGEETHKFYDLVAATSKGIPIDIEDYIGSNKYIKAFIRTAIDGDRPKRELCTRFIKNLVGISSDKAQKILDNTDRKAK